MRFMILRKADKNTEAGAMPSTQLIAEMMRYNEDLVKAGVMLAGDGLHPTPGCAGQVLGREADRNRRAFHRDEGANRRFYHD